MPLIEGKVESIRVLDIGPHLLIVASAQNVFEQGRADASASCLGPHADGEQIVVRVFGMLSFHRDHEAEEPKNRPEPETSPIVPKRTETQLHVRLDSGPNRGTFMLGGQNEHVLRKHP